MRSAARATPEGSVANRSASKKSIVVGRSFGDNILGSFTNGAPDLSARRSFSRLGFLTAGHDRGARVAGAREGGAGLGVELALHPRLTHRPLAVLAPTRSEVSEAITGSVEGLCAAPFCL